MSNGHYLRRQHGLVGGVCGGLAEWTGISVFWWRLLFLFLMIPGGPPGWVPYILLWLVIPAKAYEMG
jgi:phage shock protein PspC (stress-responsive transcriptional regulator)